MAETSNFLVQIIEDDLRDGRHHQVVTRFPPEPNGYLHIGHAKALCADFGLAERYGGRCHLRFDDTNPVKEDPRYAEAIQQDVRWLGFDWGEHLYWASDYFGQLYAWARQLVERDLAYVDEQTEEQIQRNRGTVESPGVPSPWRDRPFTESLRLLEEMKEGLHPDGAMVLRAKIDMAHPNMKLRDPLMYRIRNVPHPRTGTSWHIYPFYDYAHGLSDALEHVSHSFCSLEYENNRALYDWFVEHLPTPARPRQYEFARLVLPYTVLSKRRLIGLVEGGHVSGWDDPRMPTIAGLRRRGVTPAAIRAFIESVGVGRANSVVDPALLDHAIRDDLNDKAPRYMAVLDPVELLVESWPEDRVDELEASLWPHDVRREGSRTVAFTRRLFVERADVAVDPPKGWRRLAPGREVRLRYGYLVTVTGIDTDTDGRVRRVRVTHDPESRGGTSPDGRKVKGTIHWVSADRSVPMEVRELDRLFTVEHPGKDRDYLLDLNPESLVVRGAQGEPALADLPPGSHVQLERTGYFFADPVDSRQGAPVWNRVVALKDSWGKAQSPEEPSPRAAPKPPPGPAKEKVLAPEVEARATTLADLHDIERSEADILAQDPDRASWFVLAAQSGPADAVAKLMVHVLLPSLGDHPHIAHLGDLPFDAVAFGQLATSSSDGTLSSPLTRKVLEHMLVTGDAPSVIIEREGLALMPDVQLAALVEEVVSGSPDKVAAYRGGHEGLFGFFMGQVMKQSQGKADPERARALLGDRLGSADSPKR